MEYRIEVGGHGGQGIVLMSSFLACMGMLKDWQVTWFPSYGAEMRGGSAYCSVVLSTEPVASPLIRQATHLMVLNGPSLNKLLPKLAPGGTVIYNCSLVPEDPREQRSEVECYPVPASEIAERLGTSKVANMVMLGAFLQLTGLASDEEAESVLRERTPARHADMVAINLEAIKTGRTALSQAREGAPDCIGKR